MRVFSRLSQIREPSALRGFVLGVALRVRQTEVRRLMRWRSFFVEQGDDVHEAPSGETGGGEESADSRRLWAAIERLDGDARLLFDLRHVEELELQAMAEVLGVSLSTVKRRLGRAMTRIARLLELHPEFQALLAERGLKERLR